MIGVGCGVFDEVVVLPSDDHVRSEVEGSLSLGETGGDGYR
jgi:hypothetical protein